MDIAAQVRAATLAATEAAREARAGIAAEPCGFTSTECAAWRDELLSEPEPEVELEP